MTFFEIRAALLVLSILTTRGVFELVRLVAKNCMFFDFKTWKIVETSTALCYYTFRRPRVKD